MEERQRISRVQKQRQRLTVLSSKFLGAESKPLSYHNENDDDDDDEGKQQQQQQMQLEREKSKKESQRQRWLLRQEQARLSLGEQREETQLDQEQLSYQQEQPHEQPHEQQLRQQFYASSSLDDFSSQSSFSEGEIENDLDTERFKDEDIPSKLPMSYESSNWDDFSSQSSFSESEIENDLDTEKVKDEDVPSKLPMSYESSNSSDSDSSDSSDSSVDRPVTVRVAHEIDKSAKLVSSGGRSGNSGDSDEAHNADDTPARSFELPSAAVSSVPVPVDGGQPLVAGEAGGASSAGDNLSPTSTARDFHLNIITEGDDDHDDSSSSGNSVSTSGSESEQNNLEILEDSTAAANSSAVGGFLSDPSTGSAGPAANTIVTSMRVYEDSSSSDSGDDVARDVSNHELSDSEAIPTADGFAVSDASVASVSASLSIPKDPSSALAITATTRIYRDDSSDSSSNSNDSDNDDHTSNASSEGNARVLSATSDPTLVRPVAAFQSTPESESDDIATTFIPVETVRWETGSNDGYASEEGSSSSSSSSDSGENSN